MNRCEIEIPTRCATPQDPIADSAICKTPSNVACLHCGVICPDCAATFACHGAKEHDLVPVSYYLVATAALVCEVHESCREDVTHFSAEGQAMCAKAAREFPDMNPRSLEQVVAA